MNARATILPPPEDPCLDPQVVGFRDSSKGELSGTITERLSGGGVSIE